MSNKNTEKIKLTVSDAQDMINPFAQRKNGILSDQYFALIDFYGKRVSGKKIDLEFGENVTEQDRKNVRRAFYNSMSLFFGETRKELKRLTGMAIWFALSLVGSCLFMFLVGQDDEDIVVMLGSILAYFFFVRLVMIVFSKILPLYKKRRSILTLNPLDDSAEKILSGDAVDEITDGEKLCVEACVSEKKDIVRPSVIEETEIITDKFANYLLQAMPIIENQKSMILEIYGLDINKDEKIQISNSIRAFFGFLYDDTESEINAGRKSLRINVAAIVALSVIMYLAGCLGGVTIYEIIFTVIWILADCTLEMVFLSKNELKERLKKYRLLRDMEVEFGK